jgi:hypothetical protein
MNLDKTITFQLTTADSFGDDTVSTSYETPAAVEQASAFNRGINAELDTGSLVAWIAPDSEVWTDRRFKIVGMVATFDGETYRVSSSIAGSSLVSEEDDLIELTLVKDDVWDGD